MEGRDERGRERGVEGGGKHMLNFNCDYARE